MNPACFHPSKEVSEDLHGGVREAEVLGFHPSKEVSEEDGPRRSGGRGSGVSIPLRKFRKDEAERTAGVGLWFPSL